MSSFSTKIFDLSAQESFFAFIVELTLMKNQSFQELTLSKLPKIHASFLLLLPLPRQTY